MQPQYQRLRTCLIGLQPIAKWVIGYANSDGVTTKIQDGAVDNEAQINVNQPSDKGHSLCSDEDLMGTVCWEAMRPKRGYSSSYIGLTRTSSGRLQKALSPLMSAVGLLMMLVLVVCGCVVLLKGLGGMVAYLMSSMGWGVIYHGMVTAAGVLLVVAGLAVGHAVFSPLVFDGPGRRFYRGFWPKEGRHACALYHIRALQALRKLVNDGDGRVSAYELNLLLYDGSRIHIGDYPRQDAVREEAGKIADFLHVPVWEQFQMPSTAPQKQRPTSTHAQKWRLPFPWFELMVPNLVLLLGVFWLHWDAIHIIWLVFVEILAMSVAALMRSMAQRNWAKVLSGVLDGLFLILWMAIPAVIVFVVLHMMPTMGKPPVPSPIWFAAMFLLLLCARMLAWMLNGWRQRQSTHDPGNTYSNQSIVLVFMMVWLGFLLTMLLLLFPAMGAQPAVGFVLALVVVRMGLTLGGYGLQWWLFRQRNGSTRPLNDSRS